MHSTWFYTWRPSFRLTKDLNRISSLKTISGACVSLSWPTASLSFGTVYWKGRKWICCPPSIFTIPTKLFSIPLLSMALLIVVKCYAAIIVFALSLCTLITIPSECTVCSSVNCCALAIVVALEWSEMFFTNIKSPGGRKGWKSEEWENGKVFHFECMREWLRCFKGRWRFVWLLLVQIIGFSYLYILLSTRLYVIEVAVSSGCSMAMFDCTFWDIGSSCRADIEVGWS